MEKIVINGGKPLNGEINVSGSKNAAVGIIIACMLVKNKITLENVPSIKDVDVELEIIRRMGATVNWVGSDKVEIDATNIKQGSSPPELVAKMRASYYLVGAELGRFGRANVGGPGGCNFCQRPIDQHIKAFTSIGAVIEDIDSNKGSFVATTKDGLKGNTVSFDVVSVGATMNLMIAATCAEGTTIIENPAREPHVVDLANFLNKCGAEITGAGTPGKIKIIGKSVDELHGCTYSISPDMIEAGTYMAAAAITGGELKINKIIPKHLECIAAKLREMGVKVESNEGSDNTVIEGDEFIVVKAAPDLKSVDIRTMAYPGFPTDMQSQICVLLCLAKGKGRLTEAVWDTRFGYVDQLLKMGAKITLEKEGKTAVVEGVDKLRGAKVKAVDLRAGAAMIIAGLVAGGTTEIEDIYWIERGYEDIVGKLSAVGADIKKVNFPD